MNRNFNSIKIIQFIIYIQLNNNHLTFLRIFILKILIIILIIILNTQ